MSLQAHGCIRLLVPSSPRRQRVGSDQARRHLYGKGQSLLAKGIKHEEREE